MTASENGGVKKESNKPYESRFIQQTLPTMYPVLDTSAVTPMLFIISIIFLPLGIGIWLFSENVGEVTIPYTDCMSRHDPAVKCDSIISNLSKADCICLVDFSIGDELEKDDVYMYYSLTNYYYQNHLKYYNSKDEKQLRGEIGTFTNPKKPASKCDDFREVSVTGADTKYIWPCGAIANWMFNDVIKIYRNPNDTPFNEETSQLVPLLKQGITIDSDKNTRKYKNPKYFNNPLHPIWKKFTEPPAWKTSWWTMDRDNISNNGVENEDFIVWMRVAAFPNFRKLYRILDKSKSPYENGLPRGNYTLHIEYNYLVTNYDGTKAIIFSTTKIIGGQNHFLGLAYIAVGGGCLFLTIILFMIHIGTRLRNKTRYTLESENKNE